MTQDFMKELDLVDRLSRTKISDDDLFAYAPRRTPPPMARITCRVCERQGVLHFIDTPGLLCPLCREDLDRTSRHIHEVLSAGHARFLAAYDRLSAAEAQADPETQARYVRVQESLAAAAEGTLNVAGVKRRYEEAKARNDALGALLRERDAATAVAEEFARLEVWAERGFEEVGVARG